MVKGGKSTEKPNDTGETDTKWIQNGQSGPQIIKPSVPWMPSWATHRIIGPALVLASVTELVAPIRWPRAMQCHAVLGLHRMASCWTDWATRVRQPIDEVEGMLRKQGSFIDSIQLPGTTLPAGRFTDSDTSSAGESEKVQPILLARPLFEGDVLVF